jgi:hypothetical protein
MNQGNQYCHGNEGLLNEKDEGKTADGNRYDKHSKPNLEPYWIRHAITSFPSRRAECHASAAYREHSE